MNKLLNAKWINSDGITMEINGVGNRGNKMELINGLKIIAADMSPADRMTLAGEIAPDGVAEGLKIIEEALAKASSGDLSQAPFTLTGSDAALWLRATASAYRHALEMLSIPGVGDTIVFQKRSIN